MAAAAAPTTTKGLYVVVATVRSAHDVELSDCAHAAGLVLELMCGDQVHHTKVCTSETCPRVLASKAIALTAEMFPEGASQLGAYTRVSVDMDSHSETPLATPELFVGFRVFGPVAATAAAPTLPQVGSAASSLSHSTAASGSVVSRVDSDSSMDVSVLNTPSWKAVQRSSPAVKRDLRAVFASFSTSNTAFLSFTELAAGIHLRFVRACLQRVGMRKRYSDVGLVALSQYCARQCYKLASIPHEEAMSFQLFLRWALVARDLLDIGPANFLCVLGPALEQVKRTTSSAVLLLGGEPKRLSDDDEEAEAVRVSRMVLNFVPGATPRERATTLFGTFTVTHGRTVTKRALLDGLANIMVRVLEAASRHDEGVTRSTETAQQRLDRAMALATATVDSAAALLPALSGQGIVESMFVSWAMSALCDTGVPTDELFHLPDDEEEEYSSDDDEE